MNYVIFGYLAGVIIQSENDYINLLFHFITLKY